ncbi:MAG TPA: DEAD/DEAH box helicase [Verrucomicrobiae bacterium]|nr:DEAD/DEAH box helicase [Verrucomicrobiae bacterium]
MTAGGLPCDSKGHSCAIFRSDRAALTRKIAPKIITFNDLGLQPALLRAISDMGFTQPTPIQQLAIPPAMEGDDVLASAQTGSGKSAAFGLPIIDTLIDDCDGVKPRALILAPTRELTDQIAKHLMELAKYTKVRVCAVYGGVGFKPQASALKRGVDIVVATPGRLLDHMAQKTIKLDQIDMLVLDEADRMLDMGFLPDVRRILRGLPTERQTLFFSATLPPAISALVKEMLHEPVRVELTPKATPVETLRQTVYAVPQEHKTDLLLELLKDNTIYSAIAFTRTKARANRLAAALSRQRVSVELIHGDRTQAQRTRALDSFKRGKHRILVATDIAARGIDVDKLGHVINYDVPMVPDDFVHRIGRTARAQEDGDAITFVSHDEEPLFRAIEQTLGRRLERSVNPLFPQASIESPKPRVVYRSKPRRRR